MFSMFAAEVEISNAELLDLRPISALEQLSASEESVAARQHSYQTRHAVISIHVQKSHTI